MHKITLTEDEAKVLLGILDHAINETASPIIDELASGIYFKVKQA
jgi:hypothetical protein